MIIIFKVELTKSQVANLKEFLEFNLIPSIQGDEDCDNINYVVDMCEIYKKLCDIEVNND